MGLVVRRARSQIDTWAAIPGDTRWVDYAHEQHDGELVIYVHLFRRLRDRFDDSRDVLLWKPSTTKVAHRYGSSEWEQVLDVERAWPPPAVEYVPRRAHHRRVRD